MLISIIIPVYNVDQYLTECLNSIRNQTFQNYEVIMINDGSTDKSPKICEEFSKADKRFFTIHKENGGQSTARNRGVDVAKGEYLIFIDSDDFFTDSNCLQKIAGNLKPDTDILSYRYFKYYSESNLSDCGINMSNLTGLGKLEIIKELVKRDSFFCSCWSKAVRRNLITENKIQFDESLSCEDMDWYFRVINCCKTIEVLDYPVINYRQREGSVTSGGFKEKNISDFVVTIAKWQTKFESLECNEARYVMLSALAKLYCNLIISFSSNRSKALPLKKKIFAHKSLLKFDLNPRTHIFKKVTGLIGLNTVTFLLNLYTRIR